jgi:uncharacterized membrane protein YedE/YeeE
MNNFTPIASLFGGALIGLSAVALMLLNGRIAGISGITAGNEMKLKKRAGLVTIRSTHPSLG